MYIIMYIIIIYYIYNMYNSFLNESQMFYVSQFILHTLVLLKLNGSLAVCLALLF